MFRDRVNQLRKKILKEKLDGVLISSVHNISYLTGYTNFSKDEREAYLLIGQDFQYLITDGRYTEALKKEVPHFNIFERGYKNKTEDLFKKLNGKIKIIGIEEDNLTVSEYKFLEKNFKKIKHTEVGNLRSIKTKDEIERIKKACKVGDLAFDYIVTRIKAGVTEKEIARSLERFITEKGAEFSFPSIVAFGKDASIPHHQTGETILGPESGSGRGGQIVLLDFGVKFENYCSDMTRTIFFGEPSKKQKEIYETVLGAQRRAVDFLNKQIKLGKKIKASQVDKIARDYIISKGYPFIPHSLGHGVGLEVHEHPYLSTKSKEVLKTGMVFSIEPGIYIPDFGGVRIEDLYILEKNGIKQITNSPKDIIII